MRLRGEKEATMNHVDLIVTRHASLAEYLREIGLAVADAPCPWGCVPLGAVTDCPACAGAGVYSTPVIEHVTDAAVLDGKRVAGVLPLHLAARCAAVVEVPINHTPETRARWAKSDGGIEELRLLAGAPVEYVCRTEGAYGAALQAAAQEGFREGVERGESAGYYAAKSFG